MNLISNLIVVYTLKEHSHKQLPLKETKLLTFGLKHREIWVSQSYMYPIIPFIIVY